MSGFLVRRVLLSILTLWFVTLLVFGAIRLLPGDAITAATNPTSGGDSLSKQQHEQLRHELGLDKPIYQQYADWFTGLFSGNLGKSISSGQRVSRLVKQAVPVSLELAIIALVAASIFGLLLGVMGSLTRGTPLDYLSRLIATLGITVPSFGIALIVLLLGVRWFNWIPPTRYTTLIDNPRTNVTQFIIPSLILCFGGMAGIARITRSSMLDVLTADYVRTAKAKGLRERVVIMRHVVRNAMIPIITVVGLQMATLLGGSIIIESIFNLPGLGNLSLNAVNNRDYPVIQVAVLVIAAFVILTNLLVDLSYGMIDPRVSLARGSR